MADKYLGIGTGGDPTEVEFTTVSTGVADAGKGIALDAGGLIDPTMLPDVPATTYTAFENLSAGDFVHVFNDGGTAKVRRADASSYSSGYRADGFVKNGYTAGQTAIVVTGEEFNNALAGLTPGTRYYLSTSTPGGLQSTVPTGAGQFVQRLGVAKTATELQFQPTRFVLARS